MPFHREPIAIRYSLSGGPRRIGIRALAAYAFCMAFDSTPEIERLVHEIRAHGTYASRTEVLAEALHLLNEHEPVQSRKCHTADTPKPNRRKLALGAWAAQVLVTIAAVVACAIDIETILTTGPALAISGLALALVAHPLRSWSMLGYSLSGPLVSAFCAALIALFQWGPNQAEDPILVILFIYALLSIPTALFVFPKILHWSTSPQSRTPLPWRYSLKSLLLVTTALCVAVPALRFLIVNVRRNDYVIFSIFVLVTMSLAGVAFFTFVAGRRSH